MKWCFFSENERPHHLHVRPGWNKSQMHINRTWKYCTSCQRRAGWPDTRKCVDCEEDELCCLFARVEHECDGVTGHDITFYTCSVPKKVDKKVNGTMCNTQHTTIENEVAFIGINYQEVMVEVSVIMGIGLVILLCTLLGCKWRKNSLRTREMRRRLQNLSHMERPPRQRYNGGQQGHINGGQQGGQQVQGGLPPAYEGEFNQNFNLGEGEFNLQNIAN